MFDGEAPAQGSGRDDGFSGADRQFRESLAHVGADATREHASGELKLAVDGSQ
jgi:hypothetical protein